MLEDRGKCILKYELCDPIEHTMNYITFVFQNNLKIKKGQSNKKTERLLLRHMHS